MVINIFNLIKFSGGYYDEYNQYIPGRGWNEVKQSYEASTHNFFYDGDEDEEFDETGKYFFLIFLFKKDEIPYDKNFDRYDDEISDEENLDYKDSTIEKVIVNQGPVAINYSKNFQNSENSANFPKTNKEGIKVILNKKLFFLIF